MSVALMTMALAASFRIGCRTVGPATSFARSAPAQFQDPHHEALQVTNQVMENADGSWAGSTSHKLESDGTASVLSIQMRATENDCLGGLLSQILAMPPRFVQPHAGSHRLAQMHENWSSLNDIQIHLIWCKLCSDPPKGAWILPDSGPSAPLRLVQIHQDYSGLLRQSSTGIS